MIFRVFALCFIYEIRQGEFPPAPPFATALTLRVAIA